MAENKKQKLEIKDPPIREDSAHMEEETDSLLSGVEIDDEVIEQDDLNNKEAKKLAKKNAKKHLTPEEIKKAKKKKRILIACLSVILVIGLFLVPAVRFAVLNFVGFQNDIIITVLDNDKKPVNGAEATINGKSSVTTDIYGRVTLENVRFGKIPLVITKPGYAKVTTELHSDIRTGRAEPFTMKLIGIKIDIAVKDWLSGRPIKGVSAESGEAKALSDDSGVASLVVMPSEEDKLTVDLKAAGYKPKKVDFDTSVRTKETLLVADAQNYFMSVRDGRHDIYSSDLDGKNVKKIIESTGKESRELLGFAIHPDNRHAVLVANREGKVQNSMVVAGVYLIDLKDAAITKIDEGTNVNLQGWSGKFMVYTKSNPSVRLDSKNAIELKLLNIESRFNPVITAANTISDIFTYPDMVVYHAYNPFAEEDKEARLMAYHTLSGNHQELAKDHKISYLTQPSYLNLNLMMEDGSTKSMSLPSGTMQNQAGGPLPSRYYHTSADGKYLVWVERRDGKGVLLRRALDGGEEKVVASQGGFTDPLRSIGNKYLVIRSSTTSETADYVVDIGSGKIAKLNDVFDVWLGTREWR